MNSGDNLNQILELAARLLAEAAADGCALAVLAGRVALGNFTPRPSQNRT